GTFSPVSAGMASTLPLTFTTGASPLASDVLNSLNTIPGLAGNVSVFGGPGGPFTVVFNGALANTNVPQMTFTVAGGTTATPATVADGVGNETQTITLGGTSGGTFTPAFATVPSTLPLTFTPGSSPLASDVLNSLNTIPALNGNVMVFGAPGGPFTVIFNNLLGTANVPQLTFSTTGGTTATPATTAEGFGNEIQTLTLGGTSGGTATLSFNTVPGAPALTFVPGTSPTAADVLTHLNSIPALAGNVAVLGAPGGPFTIVFLAALAKTNVSQLTAATTGGTTATVATLAEGIGNVQDAIIATNPGVLAGKVTVTTAQVSSGANGQSGRVYLVTFDPSLGDVQMMTVSGAGASVAYLAQTRTETVSTLALNAGTGESADVNLAAGTVLAVNADSTIGGQLATVYTAPVPIQIQGAGSLALVSPGTTGATTRTFT